MDKTEALKQKTILYVEDDEDTLELFSIMLKPYVKDMYLASNGLEGLTMFEDLNPDIVITDIEMPKMNGLELLEKIKASDKNKPVIVITAFKDEAHKASKADALIIKPINKQEVLSTLKNL